MAQISSKLVGFTKNLQKSSSEILKTTKLSITLANEEERLRNIYLEIGKKVHDIYSYGGTLGGVFDEKYSELKAAEEKIAEIKSMLESVKGTRECSKCKKNVSLSFEFCPKCGMRMNEAEAVTEAVAEATADSVSQVAEAPKLPPSVAPDKMACPVCGLQNEPGTKFCYSCGRFL